MRRADRLFQIVQILRLRRVTTARQLADRLEVSERTIYRDIADLSRSGVPIEAEAGAGYRLRDYDLPPIVFDRDEIEAIVLGTRIVENWGDPELARAARRAIEKVESALPRSRRRELRDTMLFAPAPETEGERFTIDFAGLRRAIRERFKVSFGYVDAQGETTERIVRPLGLAFYGPVWVLSAWCELRKDFRAFRPDRMRGFMVLSTRFEDEPGKRFSDYLRTIGVAE